MLRFIQIHLLSATVKKAEVSYRFYEQTCFASKGFTYVLQPSTRPRSVIDSTSRNTSPQRGSLTACNRQEGRGQLSIQRRDIPSFEGIYHLVVVAPRSSVWLVTGRCDDFRQVQ